VQLARSWLMGNPWSMVTAYAMVSELQAVTGQILWQKDLNGQHIFEADLIKIAYDQGKVFVNGSFLLGDQAPSSTYTPTTEFRFYAFQANNGQELWHTTNKINTTPFIVMSGVIYASNTQDLVALNETNGQQLWESQQSANLTDPVSFTVDHNVLYGLFGIPTSSPDGAKSSNTWLVAINAQNGTLLWKRMYSQLGNYINVVNNVILLQQNRYVDNTFKICAYHTSDGTQSWCTEQMTEGTIGAATIPAVAVMNNKVYVSYSTVSTINVTPTATGSVGTGIVSNSVGAYDLCTGHLLWSRTIQGQSVFPTMLATSGGKLYMSIGHTIKVLDPNNGRDILPVIELGKHDQPIAIMQMA
jgi:PQQ-like domain